MRMRRRGKHSERGSGETTKKQTADRHPFFSFSFLFRLFLSFRKKMKKELNVVASEPFGDPLSLSWKSVLSTLFILLIIDSRICIAFASIYWVWNLVVVRNSICQYHLHFCQPTTSLEFFSSRESSLFSYLSNFPCLI